MVSNSKQRMNVKHRQRKRQTDTAPYISAHFALMLRSKNDVLHIQTFDVSIPNPVSTLIILSVHNTVDFKSCDNSLSPAYWQQIYYNEDDDDRLAKVENCINCTTNSWNMLHGVEAAAYFLKFYVCQSTAAVLQMGRSLYEVRIHTDLTHHHLYISQTVALFVINTESEVIKVMFSVTLNYCNSNASHGIWA